MPANKRKIFAAAIIILAIIGSLHCFNTTNLLMSDVANYASGAGFNYPYIFVTFSHFSLTLAFILFFFLLVRGYSMEHTYRYHMLKTYMKITMGFALVGTICSILSGTLVYHTFLAPYPYPGACIVALILNLLLLLHSTGTYVFLKLRKLPDIKKPYKKMHIFRSIVMAIFTFIAFNRFGILLSIGWWTEWEYIGLTIWFYLILPIPLIALTIFVLFRMRVLNKLKDTTFALIFSGVLSLISLALCITLMVIGMNNPLLVSLISPAMPLERLATLPIDYILLVLTTFIPTFIFFIFEIKKYFKVKRLKEEKKTY